MAAWKVALETELIGDRHERLTQGSRFCTDSNWMARPQKSPQLLSADLAERMAPPLRAFFRKRTFDPQEAEDLVQEVFCRLGARSDSSSISNPEAYVFQIAANLLRDRARQSQSELAARRDLTASAEANFEELSPERVLLARTRLQEVQK